MLQGLNPLLRRIPLWLVWGLGLLPLALLLYDGFRGGLGVDPVVTIEHRLGRTGYYFLIAGLAVTPLLRLTGLSLIRFRRALGLLAFAYIVLHLIAWVWFDMGLIWRQMLSDVVKRPYLTMGMAGLLALLPLALTSNDASIRRLGGKLWRQIHRLVYLAVPLAGLHYLWVGKVFEAAPLLWLGFVLLLLALRPLLARKRSKPAQQ